MKEALFWKKLDGKKVQCQLCNQYCLISDGGRGLCGVRENHDGTLYTLVYGKVIAEHIDPIEKKPLFHFLPGTTSYSIATVGCNLRCSFCQNADISQASLTSLPLPEGEVRRGWEQRIPGEDRTPEQIVREALHNDCASIAYTYTEPTIFAEFALDVMKLAREQGLKNVWVSNGYTTKEALETVAPYLEAANIDLKFFNDETYWRICGCHLAPILETLKLYKKLKIWLEITTLIIPGQNDDEKQLTDIAEFIVKELGVNTPWHISRFFPTYKMNAVSPTPEATIKQAYEIGKKAGLKYIYAGNTLSDGMENTYCPKCGQVVIKRFGYDIERLDDKGKCKNCGTKIDLVE
jgi:pyruvate formate lyase activating enzyme